MCQHSFTPTSSDIVCSNVTGNEKIYGLNLWKFAVEKVCFILAFKLMSSKLSVKFKLKVLGFSTMFYS